MAAVFVHEDEVGHGVDPELIDQGVDLIGVGIRGEVFESVDAVFDDERVDLVGAIDRYADKLDAGVRFLESCDRRSCRAAMRSPGGPEPVHGAAGGVADRFDRLRGGGHGDGFAGRGVRR